MKKKVLSKVIRNITIAVIILVLVCVYVIKGIPGIYAWNAAVFILAPLGVFLSLISLLILLVQLCKRKKMNKEIMVHLLLFLCMGSPILLLFGMVTVPYPADEKALLSIRVSVPVKGKTALFGGENYSTHCIWPSERFAYDILAKPYGIDSKRLEDYGVFGREVISPVNGRILKVHDGEADIEPHSENFTTSLGNYIFIKIKKTGTYLIFAHLKKNSITVKAGDEVNAGTLIGQVGNSGTTSEPHLHFQHQKNNPLNMKIPTLSEGLPITFQ